MDFSKYRLELVNVCTGEANYFSKYEEIGRALESRIREYRDERFLNTESYLKFLKFCCDIGRLDVVYFMLNVVDVNSQCLVRYLSESEEIFKIKNLSNNKILFSLQEKSLYPLEKSFNQDFKDDFFDRIKMLEKKEDTTHFDNLTLSFMLDLLLGNCSIKLSAQECIDIYQYFQSTKKCNVTRKDSVSFKLTAYCLKHNLKGYFVLPKKYYNHITSILSRLTRCSFLEGFEKTLIINIILDSVRNNNDLGSPPLKVAVCVSGMYRNHTEGIESIYENIVKPLNADVFVHTWSETSVWAGLGGSPTPQRIFGVKDDTIFPLGNKSLLSYSKWLPNTLNILQPEINKSTREDFFKRLNANKVSIESAATVINDLGDISGFTQLRGTLNQIKMFYSIKKSFDLALDTYDYDYIIKVRPDVFVSEKLNGDFFDGILNNVFYANINNPAGLSDQVFVLSSSMAYRFSQFVEKMLKQGNLSIFENYPLYDSHNLILSWLLDNNYEIGPRKIFFNTLPNAEIEIPGLRAALEEDFKNMKETDQQRFNKFKEFLLLRNG